MSDARVPLVYGDDIIGTAIVCRATYDVFCVRHIKKVKGLNENSCEYSATVVNNEPIYVNVKVKTKY